MFSCCSIVCHPLAARTKRNIHFVQVSSALVVTTTDDLNDYYLVFAIMIKCHIGVYSSFLRF